MTASIAIAAVLLLITLRLVASVIVQAHRDGMERLRRAGEPIPWWLPDGTAPNSWTVPVEDER